MIVLRVLLALNLAEAITLNIYVIFVCCRYIWDGTIPEGFNPMWWLK